MKKIKSKIESTIKALNRKKDFGFWVFKKRADIVEEIKRKEVEHSAMDSYLRTLRRARPHGGWQPLRKGIYKIGELDYRSDPYQHEYADLPESELPERYKKEGFLSDEDMDI